MRSEISALSMVLVLAASGLAAQSEAASTASPLVELDHVYVIVPQPRAAVSALRDAGITVDTRLIMPHEGQGTASVSALFENAYLEILWADSTVSLSEGSEEDIDHFPEASEWRAGGPVPFGLGLRRTAGNGGPLPYAGEEVAGGEWVEDGESFFKFEGDEDGLRAFVVPEYMALDSWKEDFRARAPELFIHPADVERLTSVRMVGVPAPPSLAEAALARVFFGQSDAAPVLELTFDDGRAGVTTDLRPELPILIRR